MLFSGMPVKYLTFQLLVKIRFNQNRLFTNIFMVLIYNKYKSYAGTIIQMHIHKNTTKQLFVVSDFG